MGVIQKIESTVSGLMYNPLPDGRLDDILRPEGDNPLLQQGFDTTNLDIDAAFRAALAIAERRPR